MTVRNPKIITILLMNTTVRMTHDFLCKTSFLFPKKSNKRLWLRDNKLILFCLRSDNESRTSINQLLRSINCFLQMKSFMLTACPMYLQQDSDGVLIRQPIPYTYEKDYRIALPEVLQERVLATFHGKNHFGGNSLANAVQLKNIFPETYQHLS